MAAAVSPVQICLLALLKTAWSRGLLRRPCAVHLFFARHLSLPTHQSQPPQSFDWLVAQVRNLQVQLAETTTFLTDCMLQLDGQLQSIDDLWNLVLEDCLALLKDDEDGEIEDDSTEQQDSPKFPDGQWIHPKSVLGLAICNAAAWFRLAKFEQLSQLLTDLRSFIAGEPPIDSNLNSSHKFIDCLKTGDSLGSVDSFLMHFDLEVCDGGQKLENGLISLGKLYHQLGNEEYAKDIMQHALAFCHKTHNASSIPPVIAYLKQDHQTINQFCGQVVASSSDSNSDNTEFMQLISEARQLHLNHDYFNALSLVEKALKSIKSNTFSKDSGSIVSMGSFKQSRMNGLLVQAEILDSIDKNNRSIASGIRQTCLRLYKSQMPFDLFTKLLFLECKKACDSGSYQQAYSIMQEHVVISSVLDWENEAWKMRSLKEDLVCMIRIHELLLSSKNQQQLSGSDTSRKHLQTIERLLLNAFGIPKDIKIQFMIYLRLKQRSFRDARRLASKLRCIISCRNHVDTLDGIKKTLEHSDSILLLPD